MSCFRPWHLTINSISGVKLVSGSDTYPNIPYNPEIRKVNYMYLEAKKCLGSFAQPGSDNGLKIGDYMVIKKIIFLNFRLYLKKN